MYPTAQPRRGGFGRLAWWTFCVLLLVYVFHHPSEAAANAHDLGVWLGHASDSIAAFLKHASGDHR